MFSHCPFHARWLGALVAVAGEDEYDHIVLAGETLHGLSLVM